MTREETRAILVRLGAVGEESTQGRWNLHEADLSEVDLSMADLSGAHLREADFRKANLSRANLSEAYLRKANLSRANLSRANLSVAYLSGADLSGTYLRGADLRGADLTDATLTAAFLMEADLTGANLSGARIDKANISGWVIKDVTCSHIIEAKSGMQLEIEFGPLEFERKYTLVRKTAEVITYLSGGNSMADLQGLIEKYEKRVKETEAHLAELRRKQDILLEAARLVEEEAKVSAACGH